jgi:DNA-binding SARP family transcriptional activator
MSYHTNAGRGSRARLSFAPENAATDAHGHPAIRLLGTLEVGVEGAARSVPGTKRKALLAALALYEGEVVSVDRLTNMIWSGSAPATALNTLQCHVSFLRREFGLRAKIIARAPGYLLDLQGESTDARIAERLIRRACQTDDARCAADLLQSALRLWRGRSLADLADLATFDAAARHLEGLRWTARRMLTEAKLAMGEHLLAVHDLVLLTEHFTLDEDLHRCLMLALYRSGRQAEALAVYHTLRTRLRQELGVAPIPALDDLYAAILRHDPALHPQDSVSVFRRFPRGSHRGPRRSHAAPTVR